MSKCVASNAKNNALIKNRGYLIFNSKDLLSALNNLASKYSKNIYFLLKNNDLCNRLVKLANAGDKEIIEAFYNISSNHPSLNDTYKILTDKTIEIIYDQMSIVLGDYKSRINEMLKECFPGKSILHQAINHLLLNSGAKRLRASLAIMSYKIVNHNRISKIALIRAIGYELAHTASLIHDDIIDKSPLRRGMPTVHHLFGEDIAILAGDALIGKPILQSVEAYRHDTTISKDTFCMLLENSLNYGFQSIYGETMEIQMQRSHDFNSVNKYLKMIKLKTASLIAGPLEAGAILGGASKSQIHNLKYCGEALGVAFQIIDDCLDYTTLSNKNIQKAIYSDIYNGKPNILLIKVYQDASIEERRNILKIIGNQKISNKKINELMRLYYKYDAIEFSRFLVRKYTKIAKKHLKIFRNNKGLSGLVELINILDYWGTDNIY